MINYKNKWFILLVVGVISITCFGSILTIEPEIKLENRNIGEVNSNITITTNK